MYLPPKSEAARKRACDYINGLSPEKAWTITVKPYVKQRSHPQNNYLHGVVLRLISDHTGMGDLNRLRHELCCIAFGYETKTIGDRTADVPLRTTSELNTAEFSAFCEWVQGWAMRELGVLLPDPNV